MVRKGSFIFVYRQYSGAPDPVPRSSSFSLLILVVCLCTSCRSFCSNERGLSLIQNSDVSSLPGRFTSLFLRNQQARLFGMADFRWISLHHQIGGFFWRESLFGRLKLLGNLKKIFFYISNTGKNVENTTLEKILQHLLYF